MLSFDAFCFWLCGGGVYYTTTQQKKIMREPDFARNPVMMSYISVLSFVMSALFISTIYVEVECQKNKEKSFYFRVCGESADDAVMEWL